MYSAACLTKFILLNYRRLKFEIVVNFEFNVSNAVIELLVAGPAIRLPD